MATVSWLTSVQITGGPTISAAQEITAEATQSIDVTIAAGAVDTVVSLQPGPAAAVQLLLIDADGYGTAANPISFIVSDGTSDSDPITLTGPQFFSGGAMAALGVAPNNLKVSNATAADIKFSVFVARDATP